MKQKQKQRNGQAKAGRPARTYIQQLCEDTEWRPEDLSKAMNDREGWRERVKDICASSTTWWWWWWWYILYIYIYIYNGRKLWSVLRQYIDNKFITRLSKSERFIEKQNRHDNISVLINHHQDCEGRY